MENFLWKINQIQSRVSSPNLCGIPPAESSQLLEYKSPLFYLCSQGSPLRGRHSRQEMAEVEEISRDETDDRKNRNTVDIKNWKPIFSPLFLQAKAKAALTVASARGGTDHQEASTGGWFKLWEVKSFQHQANSTEHTTSMLYPIQPRWFRC